MTGSCHDIDHRASRLDIFGPEKTFRDTPVCREYVQEYTCLWWGTTSTVVQEFGTAYLNRCDNKGKTMKPPCRSYCTQVAIQCANNLEYMELCANILCPPYEEECTPGPYAELGDYACSIYRYQTPRYSSAPRSAKANSALGSLATTALVLWLAHQAR